MNFTVPVDQRGTLEESEMINKYIDHDREMKES